MVESLRRCCCQLSLSLFLVLSSMLLLLMLLLSSLAPLLNRHRFKWLRYNASSRSSDEFVSFPLGDAFGSGSQAWRQLLPDLLLRVKLGVRSSGLEAFHEHALADGRRGRRVEGLHCAGIISGGGGGKGSREEMDGKRDGPTSQAHGAKSNMIDGTTFPHLTKSKRTLSNSNSHYYAGEIINLS